MSLYMIQYDGQPYHVEAATMQEAVSVWQRHTQTMYPDEPDNGGWDGTEEPEQVALLTTDAVIRTHPTPEAP